MPLDVSKSGETATEFKKSLLNNFQEAKAAYCDLPESHRGRLLSIDIARLLFPGFREKNVAAIFTEATTLGASAFIERLLEEKVAGLQKNDRVLIIAGGEGSGKTPISESMLKTENFAFVYEAVMGFQEEAVSLLKNISNKAAKATFLYVDRDIEKAMVAAVETAAATGRGANGKEAIASHLNSQKTAVWLYKNPKNLHGAEILFIKN